MGTTDVRPPPSLPSSLAPSATASWASRPFLPQDLCRVVPLPEKPFRQIVAALPASLLPFSND